MKIKEGMYVRFKDKRNNTYIRKVVDGYKEHWYGCKIDKNANNVPYVSDKNIIKTSFYIIDLIQVGDYVNGHLVIDKYNDIDDYGRDFTNITLEDSSLLNKGIIESEIKSIVTKEQFERMEYKIGE